MSIDFIPSGKANIREPFFIVGVGRSGTTLLQSMMNAHPEICFPPEIHFVCKYIANRRAHRIFNAGGLDLLAKHLRDDKYVKQLGVDINKALEPFYLRQQRFSFANLFKQILCLYGNRKGKSRIGEKDPKNLEYLSEIKKAFPEAHIIHLIRDPRDVVVSRQKANWSKNRSFFAHVFACREQLKICRSKGIKLFKERYHEIFYENLIAEPEGTLKKLCDRIGVKYNGAMLNFQKAAREIVRQDEMQWKGECLGPLLSSNTRQWEQSLKRWQVLFIEVNCSHAFSSLGYKKSGLKPEDSKFLIISFKLISMLYSLLGVMYRIVIWGRSWWPK